MHNFIVLASARKLLPCLGVHSLSNGKLAIRKFKFPKKRVFKSNVLIIAACSSLLFMLPSVDAADPVHTKLLKTAYETEYTSDNQINEQGSITSWIYTLADSLKYYVSSLEAKFYDELLSLNQQMGDEISPRGLSQIFSDLSAKLESISKEKPDLLPGNWDDFVKFIGFSPSPLKEDDSDDIPPECDMTTPEIIRHNGYPCEEHKTVTKDGYILSLHRIPHSRSDHKNAGHIQTKKPVVFIQHGLLADSSCWVSNGPNNSLPFILADAGFDIWLGNVRGNSYSRSHVKLDASFENEFWNFTWQNMAELDLPAMIDYTLAVSSQKQLHYIGHSQGTLIAFAKLSEDLEFQNKIKSVFALAPVAFLSDITSSLRSLTPLGKLLHSGINVFGGSEILPKKPLARWISSKMHMLHRMHDNDALGPGGKLVYEGNNLLMNLCGFRPESYFKEKMAVYFTHMPSGTSLHNIVHYSQLITSGRTQKWDYGSPSENLERYGQEEPPEYDLTKIKTPVFLYAGTEDQLADLVDVEKLTSKLNNVIKYCVMDDFDHLDFLWGRRSPQTIYADIVKTIKRYEYTGKFQKSDCEQLYQYGKDEL